MEHLVIRDNEHLREAVKQYFNAPRSKREEYPIGTWITTKVTDMSNLFVRKPSFNEYIGDWDTSNVTTMAGMFYGVDKFNQDISRWDTSKVTNMSKMFMFAEDFNQDISNWDVSNVTDMREMFNRARSFDQPINNWTFHPNVNVSRMFIEANSFLNNTRNYIYNPSEKIDEIIGEIIQQPNTSKSEREKLVSAYALRHALENANAGSSALTAINDYLFDGHEYIGGKKTRQRKHKRSRKSKTCKRK